MSVYRGWGGLRESGIQAKYQISGDEKCQNPFALLCWESCHIAIIHFVLCVD